MPTPLRHSTIVGGSTASRLVNCPGSSAILATLPKQVNVTSEYAEEGTDLHTLLSAMIDSDGTVWPVPGETTIGSTLITPALMHDAIEPAWDYWLELRGQLDEVSTEDEAPFPGIPGAFGTCDLSGRSARLNTTWLVDWKFGAGHSVAALYPDPDDDDFVLVNEQLLFYACCLRALYPDWFPKDVSVILNIVQPRNQDPALRLTSATVDNADLDDFENELKQALKLSARPGAHKKIGPWCRFAACKPVCPLHNAPLLDLVAIQSDAASLRDHVDALGRILDLAPVAEALIAEARKQAHELLEKGADVPGWKLVAKRSMRSWNQPAADTVRLLRKPPYRLRKAQVLEPDVVKSPAQIEKLLPKGVGVPASLAAPASSGTTLAPVGDKRPAVLPRHENLRELLQLSLEAETKAE
jgi:hypothetical protein